MACATFLLLNKPNLALQAAFYGSLIRVLEQDEGLPPSLLASGGMLASHITRELDRVVAVGQFLSKTSSMQVLEH